MCIVVWCSVMLCGVLCCDLLFRKCIILFIMLYWTLLCCGMSLFDMSRCVELPCFGLRLSLLNGLVCFAVVLFCADLHCVALCVLFRISVAKCCANLL